MELRGRHVSALTLSAEGRRHFNDILLDLPKERVLKIILLFTETDEVRTYGDSAMWVWEDFDCKLHDRGIKIFWNEVLPRLKHEEYLILRRLDGGLCQEYGSYHHNPFNLRLKTSISFEEAV